MTVLPPYTDPFRTLLLFGPPGSGKGTIGKALAAVGGHLHVSTGDIIRGLSPTSSAGKLFHQLAAAGEFAPDEGMMEIWRSYMQGLISTNRFRPDEQMLLLDGLPRTVAQVELSRSDLDVEAILYLEVSEETLLHRLQGRAQRENRQDDLDPAVLHRRLEVYREQTAAILDHYPAEKIVRVDGGGTPPQVLREVLIQLADHL